MSLGSLQVWERKYSFALLAFVCSFLVLYLVHRFGFPEKLAIVSILATDAVILIITTTYLTGAAKIDLQALYGRPAAGRVEGPGSRAEGLRPEGIPIS